MEFEDSTTNSAKRKLPIGRFSGREAFEQVVRDALSYAADEGSKELILSDATFADWPLGERAVVDSLQAWSKSGRRMTLLATRYDEVIRCHARFVSWRKAWGHLIDCRLYRVASSTDFPSVIWSSDWVIQRLDSLNSTGLSSSDRLHSRQIREALEENLRDSTPGFPSSVLGL